jgi:hypothetical protein
MNFDPKDINNHTNYQLSYGIGAFISNIELRLIKCMISAYRMISNFFNKKYQNLIIFFTNHILNTHKLSMYSKVIILITLFLILIKFISNLITSKSNTLVRPSLSLYKFFNNQIIKNKTSLLDQEHGIKILTKDEKWIKIKKFIYKRNKFSGKISQNTLVSVNEIVQEPFYRIMKFYIDYKNNKNFK